jgi:O-antigen/teichoic acid export membrane protein
MTTRAAGTDPETQSSSVHGSSRSSAEMADGGGEHKLDARSAVSPGGPLAALQMLMSLSVRAMEPSLSAPPDDEDPRTEIVSRVVFQRAQHDQGARSRSHDGGRHRKQQAAQKPAPRRRAARGVWWVFANCVSARSGTLVTGLVLARMMGPNEFGAVAVVLVALAALHGLGQVGTNTAITIVRSGSDEIVRTVMTLSLVCGLATCAGWYGAAPAFARALGAPLATHAIRMLAFSAVISGTAAAPRAVLQRRSPRAVKVLVDQVGNWLGLAVTVWLTATGHGLVSIAVGGIVGSASSGLLCILFVPSATRVGFRIDAVRIILRSRGTAAISRALLFAATSADLIVIGVVLPQADLGYYLLALCMASWPVALCSQPVRDVAPAAFARLRAGPRVARSAYISSADLLASLTIPVCLLIAGSAGNLVELIYGPAWTLAASALTWLAPLAACRAFGELTYDYFAARYSLRPVLALQVVFLITLVPAVVVGVRESGFVGVALAQVVLLVGFLAPWYLHELTRVERRAGALLKRTLVWLALAAAIALIVIGVRRNMIPDRPLELAVSAFGAAAAMGVLVYRMRMVLGAMRRAGVGARRPDALGVIQTVFMPVNDPPRYQVLRLLPPQRVPEARSPASEDSQPSDESLGRKVRSGTRWSFVNTAVMRIATFATSAILARTVFGPQAFGLYAVSQVILAVLLSANELGVSLSIIRWEGEVRNFARTVITLSVASSALFYVGLVATAQYVARLLGSPQAAGMVRVLGLCVVIDGLACVPLALLTREFAQRQLLVVNALNFLVSTGVTLWLAFSGKGAISFAWGSVAGCAVALVAATLAAPFVVLPGWNTNQARRLLRFGLPLAGASLLMLGVFNVDSAIVGATLGPAALGLYQLAFNISSWPARSISEAARRISFAGFSRVAGSTERLTEAFAKALGLLMAAAVPACVLLAALSEPLIRLVYGQRWTSAAPVLTLLALLGLLRVAYELTYDFLAAAGKRPALLGVQGWWLAALIPALIVGARTRGIVGVGLGHVLVAGLLVCPAFLWALTRCGVKVRSVLAACLWPFLGGALMAVACELALRTFGHSLWGVTATAAVAVATYAPVILPMRKLMRRSAPEPVVLAADEATSERGQSGENERETEGLNERLESSARS